MNFLLGPTGIYGEQESETAGAIPRRSRNVRNNWQRCLFFFSVVLLFVREGGHEQISAIFAGVKIHVNGYEGSYQILKFFTVFRLTKPSGPELKKLMSLHGG